MTLSYVQPPCRVESPLYCCFTPSNWLAGIVKTITKVKVRCKFKLFGKLISSLVVVFFLQSGLKAFQSHNIEITSLTACRSIGNDH